jgi:hypothetical protein
MSGISGIVWNVQNDETPSGQSGGRGLSSYRDLIQSIHARQAPPAPIRSASDRLARRRSRRLDGPASSRKSRVWSHDSDNSDNSRNGGATHRSVEFTNDFMVAVMTMEVLYGSAAVKLYAIRPLLD